MEQNDRAHGSLGNTLKRAKATRGPSAYNLFCGDFFKRDDCKDLSYAEKSEMAAAEWKQINTQDKEKYERLSLNCKTVKVDELTDVQKNKLIARHTRCLVEETLILADLGCEISTLAVDINGKVFQTGSSDGNQFLSSNPEIGIKFRGYFGESNRSYNRSDVQNLFNRKYSEAMGKICRVPYLKGGFEVIGMPEGIEFKKPYNYGAHQIKRIMEAADDISFFIQDPEELLESNTPSSSTVTSNGNNMESIKRLLEKIAGSESAEKVLKNATEKIPEEDVEVVNLDLTEDEKLILYANCEKYFSPDGWLAVGHNMQHSSSSKDLLLPVYTEAEEKFWLFLVNEKPSRIAKSVFTTKIKGRWLNLEANGQYSILNKSDSILGKNIIRTAHGPLYLDYCHGSHDNYELPDASKNAILEILNNTGFVQTIYRQA